MPNNKDNWELEAIGKNVHSVYTLCLECRTWGVNAPLNKVCGDCGDPNGLTYYDSKTITKLLKAQEEEIRKEERERIAETIPSSLDMACDCEGDYCLIHGHS